MNRSMQSDVARRLPKSGRAEKFVSEKCSQPAHPSAAISRLSAPSKRYQQSNGQSRWHRKRLVYNPDRKKGCAISSQVRQ